jgi:CRISPR locus-related DNA-binding protein
VVGAYKNEVVYVKSIVFTLGFDVTSVIATLSGTGLEGKEHLVFIVPATLTSRAVSSQKSLENHLEVLNARGFKLTYEFLSVREDDSAGAIAHIYNTLVKYDEILVELSGGLRYLILVTYLAAMVLRQRVREVAVRLESDGRRVLIPLLEPSKLTQSDARMLRELKSAGYQNQRQLATSIGRRISSVSRTLARLEKMGFVSSRGSRPSTFGITLLGEVFLLDYESTKKQE